MPETMTEQAATIYVKTVYENLGVDTEKLQNSYILRMGGKMLALAFFRNAQPVSLLDFWHQKLRQQLDGI